MKLIPQIYKGQTTGYRFWCPGCEEFHSFRIARFPGDKPDAPIWAFNGNLESPTFTPSLRYLRTEVTKGCHLVLTAGLLSYLNDCDHALAGKKVQLGEVPE
jgi:hypothetical protein